MTDRVMEAVLPRRSCWINLLWVLLLALPPLVIEVHRPAPTRIMETLSFLSSQETWLRVHQGESDAWKMPTWNGRPRIQKPPLLVWLNLLVWHGLTPENAPVADLVARSRWLTVGLALATVAAAYGMGWLLGGPDLATLAGLATGLSAGFIRQARYASYDTHLMAWVALSVLGAVWACRLPHTARWQHVLAWGAAAAFLTAANYTKGPLGFALTLPGWTAAVACLSDHRRRDAVCYVVAFGLAAAAMGLWFAWVHRFAPNADDLLWDEYTYVFEIPKSPFFYVIVLGLVFPWTFWLVGGIAWPAWKSTSSNRRAGWFIWAWFVTVWILLSLSPVKNKRYLAPLFPMAGLSAAYAWIELQQASSVWTHRLWGRRLAALHWGALTLATFALPVFAALESWAVARGLLRRATFGADAWVVWGIAPCLLLPLWWGGLRAFRLGPMRVTALCTAAWFSAAATFGFYAYARTPRQQFDFRADAEQLAAWSCRAPLYYISRFQPPYHEAMPSHELLIYFRGVIPAAAMDELLARAAHGETLLVLTRLDPADEQRLAAAGFHHVHNIRDGRWPDWKLMASNVPAEVERSLNR